MSTFRGARLGFHFLVFLGILVAPLAVWAQAAPSPSQGTPPPNRPDPSAKKFHEGEILVRFKESASPATRARAVEAHGASLMKRPKAARGPYRRVKIRKGQSVGKAVSLFKAKGVVAEAQPNYRYYPDTLPNDPELENGNVWGLHNTATGNDIRAQKAWDYQKDCSTVTVAVIDSGINYTHADLAGNMWDGGSQYPNHGYDFASNDDDPMPTEGMYHGTHVAGIIGAVGNNGSGIPGVCWNTEIMSLRALSPLDNEGGTYAVSESIRFAVDHGADIINMSLGTDADDPELHDAIAYAEQNGVLAAVSAGNEYLDLSNNPHYPCSYNDSNIICVAAVDSDFNLASFSNYGTTDVDLAAPGTNVLSPVSAPIGTLSPFSWDKDGGNWGYRTCLGYDALADPFSSCVGSGTYNDSLDSHTTYLLDLSDPDLIAARFSFHYNLDTASGDYFEAWHDSGDADPVGDSGAINDFKASGYSYSSTASASADFSLKSCLGDTCTVAFRLNGNGDGTVGSGVSVFSPTVYGTLKDTTALGYLAGTSMSTPYVTGLAALLKAYAPGTDVPTLKGAILNGGQTVSGLDLYTATGKVADAVGSLEQLNARPSLETVNATSDGGTTTIDLAPHASDPHGDPLTVSVISQPQYGSASVNPASEPGELSVTYDPDPDWSGTEDSFEVQVSDGLGGVATGTVQVGMGSTSGGRGSALAFGGCALGPPSRSKGWNPMLVFLTLAAGLALWRRAGRTA